MNFDERRNASVRNREGRSSNLFFLLSGGAIGFYQNLRLPLPEQLHLSVLYLFFFSSFPLLTILSLFVSFDDVTYNPATRFFPVLLFGNTTYYIMVEINSILDTKFNFSVILRMILLPLSLSFSFTLSFTFNYSSSCISLNILYRKRIVHKELRPIGIVCER